MVSARDAYLMLISARIKRRDAEFGKWRNPLLFYLLLFFLAFVGCTSPELTRTRGGGPGADVGNRKQFVNMHEGSRPFEDTPKIIPGQSPSLDPAQQADRLSRR
jgi:hypothetical protein